MRKKIFTMLAAVCSLSALHAADVTNYAELKAALAGSDTEIRLAVGVYTIEEGAGHGELVIPSGKTVIGGFKGGFTDAHRVYPGAATSKEDMTILDGNSLVKTVPGDKHRVATVQGMLEGVVIRNGHARDFGGGVLVDGGTVQNCIIKGNVAMNPAANDALGGGAYLQNGGKLINCVVAFNMANNGYGVAGEGEVINNTITANTFAPVMVAVTGGVYKHFKQHTDATNPPSSVDYDTQDITISNFAIAETQTTNGQYAVFAAAMDLEENNNDGKYKFANDMLKVLIDPTRNEAVGTYMGFTASDILFHAGADAAYGLQLVGDDFIYPVNRMNEVITYVSWYGALAYSLWLGGSLPTEGQWEYAARFNGSGLDNTFFAGTHDINELGDYAWYSNNSSSRVHEVATKLPNNADLFDMNGNVWEWCADLYDGTGGKYPDYTLSTVSTFLSSTDPINNVKGSNRAVRGGSWYNAGGSLALGYRYSNPPTDMNRTIGFRPVLVP